MCRSNQIKNDFFNVNKLCSDSLYRKKINKMDALRVLLLLLSRLYAMMSCKFLLLM